MNDERADRVGHEEIPVPSPGSALSRRGWLAAASGLVLAASGLMLPGCADEAAAGDKAGGALESETKRARKRRKQKRRCQKGHGGKDCPPGTFLGQQIEFVNERAGQGVVHVEDFACSRGHCYRGEHQVTNQGGHRQFKTRENELYLWIDGQLLVHIFNTLLMFEPKASLAYGGTMKHPNDYKGGTYVIQNRALFVHEVVYMEHAGAEIRVVRDEDADSLHNYRVRLR